MAGSLERTVDYLKRALELEPDYVAAMALLASTYLDMDEFGSLSITESLRLSGRLIDKALQLDPNQLDAWVAQGHRQLRFIRMAWSVASLLRVLELAPSHIRALGSYSNVLMSLGRFREALENNRTLADLDSQNPNHLLFVETALATFGENQHIEAKLGELRERHYNAPRFYDASATYYRNGHQYDRMIQEMQRTRALGPAGCMGTRKHQHGAIFPGRDRCRRELA